MSSRSPRRAADPDDAVLERAGLILAPYWAEIAAAFMDEGHAEPSKAGVFVHPGMHDSCRHFAGAAPDGSEVYFAPEMAGLPDGSILAIMAHEAGHLVDLSNPGIWWWRFGELRKLELPRAGSSKIIRSWQARTPDEEERVADGIAEAVLGRKIGYAGTGGCLIQVLDRGSRRPHGLR